MGQQVAINIKTLAREVRQMLDFAALSMEAGVKSLDGYLYSSMARGALESAMRVMEMTADDDTDSYRQISKLDVEAVALCDKFGQLYEFHLKQVTAQPMVPVLAVQPNGQFTHQEPQPKRRVRHIDGSSRTFAGHTSRHPASFRLSASQRMEIWQWGQEHPHYTRQDILELCEIYGTTDMTIYKWLKTHPGEHN